MPEPASISTGIAARYATALFDLALEDKSLGKVESDLDTLESSLDDSPDFAALIRSPIYSREDQGAAMAALAKKMGLTPLVTNTLGIMAAKRRLFVLPQMLRALRTLVAENKGEVTADVASAKALSDAQAKKLAETLKAQFGKTVNIKATVDESLIGGLVVKVGSKMIDTSIKAKLNSLQNAMKEVG